MSFLIEYPIEDVSISIPSSPESEVAVDEVDVVVSLKYMSK